MKIRKLFGAGAVFAAALTCLLLTGQPAFAKGTQSETINKGIYLGEIDAGGMTKEEAESAVENYIEELDQVELDLHVNDEKVTVTAGDLGLQIANPEVIDEAMDLGKSGNIVQRYKALKDLEHEPQVFELRVKPDEAVVRALVEEECTKFDVKAQNAGLKREGGKFTVVPGKTGLKVDVDTSVDTIIDYVAGEWDHETADIELAVEVDEPKGTAEELSRVKDLLGGFTTNYSSSDANRSGNISSGAKHINGSVVYPGDEFSVYEAVSPFTEANGYHMAGAYENGMVVDSIGGGICQVSTTLYNAVLLSELEVTERSPHSMVVTYVNPSQDAAIAGTYKDLKFKNNTDAPIYIEGYTEGKNITFNIYGEESRPSNRKVRYESETIEKIDPGAKIIGDPALPAGYKKVTQGAHPGVKAQLWKIVTVDGVEESREVINKSTYSPSPKFITIGLATEDPNLAQQLNDATVVNDEAYLNAVLGGSGALDSYMQQQQQAAEQQQEQPTEGE